MPQPRRYASPAAGPAQRPPDVPVWLWLGSGLALAFILIPALLISTGKSPNVSSLPAAGTHVEAPLSPLQADAAGIRAIDGDTIRVGSKRIRLHGIDAPEHDQWCFNAAHRWACGRAATQQLQALLDSGRTTCTPTDRDRFGRTIAKCYVDGSDIQARMVEVGLAMAYVRYSNDYAEQQESAQEQRRGIWSGYVQAPENWRRMR